MSRSSSRSSGSSCTSGNERLLVFIAVNVGDDGVSVSGECIELSRDETELPYLTWPRLDSVGVVGEEEGQSEGVLGS